LPGALLGKECLPQSRTFIGITKFQSIVQRALSEQWQKMPMGQRVATAGMAMLGTPYTGYTLEIDDRIESPSVNFNGLDCWTFFEIALGLARMVERQKTSYEPSDLLAEIEFTRYRAGQCSGGYLERIHYLAEWYYDNAARRTIEPITPSIGPTERIYGRKIREMTVLWKSYRYLKNNPSLLPEMAQHEARIAQYPFVHIPKSQVAAVESKIQSGDIIGIVTNQHGGFCSHVGLALRDAKGVTRFMHASKNHKKVVIDDAIHTYLNRFKYHAGILVARPLARSQSIGPGREYERRLRALTR
jgi:hypothetical protein